VLLTSSELDLSSHGVLPVVANRASAVQMLSPVSRAFCTYDWLRHVVVLFMSLVTGYSRQLGLKNMDKEQVAEKFKYLRNALGHKTPTHNKVGMGVVNRKRVSVQGYWHNSAELRFPPFPHEVELRKQRAEEVGFSKLVGEVGIAGVVRMMQRLMELQEQARQDALAKLPKPVITPATE
jgi:hypothetical protein